MEIPSELRPVDTPVRKRLTEAQRTPAGGTPAPAKSGSAASASETTDRASFSDAASISRYVQVLKTANPTQLHKVEELRARISDGTYSAEPEELADLILGGRPNHGTRA